MEAVVEDMRVKTMVEMATREEEMVMNAVVVDVDKDVRRRRVVMDAVMVDVDMEAVVGEAVDTEVEAVVVTEAKVEDMSVNTMVVVGGGGC
ncbi:hypothetical protein Bca52824_035704 [Brassica carinata]|uniref:Uncharacterized protein n=1 Tax=Brassica carinata TaxID=52824 RepID=A0A8X7S3X2_BRACI|nr:hypothetical protein Bca52824_035704 [Brassica carinata]